MHTFHVLLGTVTSAFTSLPGDCDTAMQYSAIQNPFNHLQSLALTQWGLAEEENTSAINGSHVQLTAPNQGGGANATEQKKPSPERLIIPLSNCTRRTRARWVWKRGDELHEVQSVIVMRQSA